MDTLSATMEYGVNDIQSLNKISNIINQSNNLTNDAIKLSKIAIESISNRLGIPHRTTTLAMESLDSSKEIVLEGIGSFIKRIWEGIIKSFLWILNKIKSFFTDTYFSVSTQYKHIGMDARYEKMRRLNSSKDVYKDHKKVDFLDPESNIIKTFFRYHSELSNETLDIDQLFHNHKQSLDVAKKGLYDFSNLLDLIFTKPIYSVNDINEANNAVVIMNDLLLDYKRTAKELSHQLHANSKGNHNYNEPVDLYAAYITLVHCTDILTFTSEEQDSVPTFHAHSYRNPIENDVSKYDKIKPLTKEECENYLNKLDSIKKEVLDNSKVKTINNTVSKTEKFLNTVLSVNNTNITYKPEFKEYREHIENISKIVISINNFMSLYYFKVYQLNDSFCDEVLAFIDFSIKHR